MTTFNLANIMDAIAATLVAQSVSTTANTFAYPAETYTPGQWYVGYPTDITFDLTAKRGADTAIFPVHFVAGSFSEKVARDSLSTALSGSATTALKTALESGNGTLGGVVSSTHVTDAQAERLVATDGTVYIAARFAVEVIT